MLCGVVSGPMHAPVVHLDELMTADLAAPRRWPTGAAWLDECTAGIQPRDLWVVTGRPGEGKTALVVELSVVLAGAGASVVLTAPGETPGTIRDRLASAVAPEGVARLAVPLGSGGRRSLEPLDLDIWVDTEGYPLDATHRGARPPFEVSVVDDAHGWDGSLVEPLIAEACGGAAVIVAVPYDAVVDVSGDLAGRFAQEASVVIDVRTTGLPIDEDHLAEVRLLKNRRGPLLGAKHLNRIYSGRILRAPAYADEPYQRGKP